MFLVLDQVGVRYAGSRASHDAVQGVSLTLAKGQIGVLIGPSGCGKTSLLRAVAGLERLAAGRVTMGGRLLADSETHVPAEARRIGMVFQDYALFPHLNVRDNVAFGVRDLPRAARDERIGQVLELVGLAHAAKRAPHQLSGGQQQRVALARALAPQPQLLLLDEPFSNLDVELRERLAHDIRAILQQAGTTALFVTHDQIEAFAIGDTIGVMHRGRLEQWDDAYTLYHRPATRFVADFIGHGVFAPARIVATADGPRVQTPLGRPGRCHRVPPARRLPRRRVRCAAARRRHRPRRRGAGKGLHRAQGLSRLRVPLHAAPGQRRARAGPCAQPP